MGCLGPHRPAAGLKRRWHVSLRQARALDRRPWRVPAFSQQAQPTPSRPPAARAAGAARVSIQGERKMSLKPFTYPLPETRFLHVDNLVYKFKIQYGNFSRAPDLNNTDSIVQELEEAIRVILGNLDDLHPFSTNHFTVFPCTSFQSGKIVFLLHLVIAGKNEGILFLSEDDLSKWERVSKMRFKHENVHLVPYPYICTMYLELNSFQQNVSGGKEVNKGSDELESQNQSSSVPSSKCLKVKRRNEVSERSVLEETVKRRRVEIGAQVSCPQLSVDRTGAECVPHMSEAEHGFEMNSSTENKCEFSPAFLTMVCNQASFWGPMESNLEQRAATSQTEDAVQLLQQMDQMVNKGTMESAGGLSKFWRSKIFLPLQHLFGGKN